MRISDPLSMDVAAFSLQLMTHSTRSITELVGLLQQGRVELIVDIRTTPRSRTNPQFNSDVLSEALSAYQIGHVLIAELGGRRKKSNVLPPNVNGF